VNLLPDGVRGKLDVSLAKEADRFQEIGFAQGDSGPAVRAGNLLAKVSGSELDMDATPGAGHSQEWSGGLMD